MRMIFLPADRCIHIHLVTFQLFWDPPHLPQQFFMPGDLPGGDCPPDATKAKDSPPRSPIKTVEAAFHLGIRRHAGMQT